MPTYYTEQERRTINTSRGIIVDPEDEWLLDAYIWSINEDGYAVTGLVVGANTQKRVFLHHAIMGYPIWEDSEIDHKDRNKNNYRRSNLRYVDHFTQTLNRNFPLGETGARNITLRSNGKYKVQLYRRYQWIYLGQYDTLDEAVATRDEWIHLNDKECVSSTK